MTIDTEDFLEHYGIKGMKWGVRRKVRGTEGRAQRLERQAERRPTRGNVRSADRARKMADSRATKKAKGSALVKQQLPGNTNKRDVKIASKMSKGEKAATLIVGGPIGMLAYKGGKIAVAKKDLSRMDPKAVAAKQAAVKARSKMSKGEKAATFIIGGPVGMAAYKGGKILGARAALADKKF